ncbi:MAG: diacylglycerol kinase family protein [Actinomycetota bacterium]
MSSPYGEATAIIGITKGGGPAMSAETLDELLTGSGIDYKIVCAAAPGDATELARKAVEDGCGYLVSVGDDWALHEVINGIMGEGGPINPELVLAVIPTEDGSDFLRTFGLSASPSDSVNHLDGEPFFGIDVGRITWAPGASPGFSYFINMAQAGIGGDMAKRRKRMPSRLGRVADLLAFWLTLGFFKIPKGAVRIDRRSYGGPLANLIVANGQFIRDGVRMAVKAHPGDGKFDVLIQKGTKRDYVETMNKSLKGEHLPSKVIKEYLSSRVEVVADVPLPVEVDGKLLGFTPAIFEIVPQACRLKI